MGVVYRARELALQRPVALKLVAPERAEDATFRARFERESRVAASIDHPNVIPVYAAGEEDGRLYLLMRWVEGTDLQEVLARGEVLDPARAAALVAQVGAGLEAAHAAGLVHRDVKPANVLIAGDAATGHVYLSDFGLTREVSSGRRLTATGEWLGTVDFMAPEQLDGGDVDARTDLYALGCVLHAALTGRPPFPRDTVTATMLAHLSDPPPRPSAEGRVPAAFDAVVARALAKHPDDRYQSASELVTAAMAAAREPIVRPSNGGPVPATLVLPEAPEMPEAPDMSRPPAAPKPPDSSGSPEPGPTARISRSRRRLNRPARVASLIVLTAVLLVGALLGTGALGAREDSSPLTESEVRQVLDKFSDAYAREDANALRDSLARDVRRVTSGDRQRGRERVVAEYRRQFATNRTRDYTLQDVEVTPGATARASGRYVVSRRGSEPITGRIAFGLERDHGNPAIGLIAATPD
jgi:serine/threonine-protein kinase